MRHPGSPFAGDAERLLSFESIGNLVQMSR